MTQPNIKLTHATKRIFDIVVSIFFLVVLSPLILFFLVTIFLEHSVRQRPFDPLLYKETRFSRGEPFTLYKFNIFKYDIVMQMRERGEFINTKQLERDGAVLCIGWVLKQIYLDELPQLFNILVGDMSLVGPRPVNRKTRDVLHAQGITCKDKVKAGLTGYYQQLHKYAGGITQEEADCAYVHYFFSQPWYKLLYFDLKILGGTLLVLLRAKGV